MTLRQLLNQPLTIHARALTGELDEYNDPAPAVAAPPVPAQGYVEQVDSQEMTVDRDTTAVTHRAVLAPGTKINALDQIEYAGVRYEVVGAPAVAWNPRTRTEHHITVSLRGVANG